MDRKIRKLGKNLWIVFLMVLVMACSLVSPAYAEEISSQGVGYLAVMDKKSEEYVSYPAIALQGSAQLVVYTAYRVLGQGDENYYYIALDDDTPIEVTLGEIDEQMGVVGFYGETSGGYEVAKARRGQEVYLVGYNLQEQKFEYYNTSIESVSDSGTSFHAELSEYVEDLFYPAVILDSENRCLGLVYDTFHVFLFLEPEEGAAGGGLSKFVKEYWYLVLAAVLGGIGGLIGTVRRRSEKKEEPQSTDENGLQPAPAPAFQAEPQPYVPPQPVQPQSVQPQPVPPTSPWNVPPQAPSVAPRPSSQDSAVLRLRGVKGALNGRTYPIGTGGLTIGRSADNTVAFPGDTKGVSREHCRVYWSRGVLMLMDVGSSYGTALEGKGKLAANSPIALKCGDIFYVGSKDQAFRVEM